MNAIIYAHVQKKGENKPLFFNIRTDQDFLLRAETKEEKEEWTRILKENVTADDKMRSVSQVQSGKGSFIGKTLAQRKAEAEAKENQI